MTEETIPDFWRTVAELDGGTVAAQASRALVNAAKAKRDLDTKTKAKVRIELVLDDTKGSGQLLIESTTAYTFPTETGKISEESHASTLVYVHRNGHMSVLPENQLKFDFNNEKA